MAIEKRGELPEKKPRGKFYAEIRDLRPGESLLITGVDVCPKTLSQLYTAASRQRKSILTQKGVTGITVWLNPEKHKPEEPVAGEIIETNAPPMPGQKDMRTQDQKKAYLQDFLLQVESGNLEHISEPPEVAESMDHWAPDEHSQADKNFNG